MKFYSYTFVPLPLDNIRALTIDRTNIIPPNESPEPFTRHHYPFNSLQSLKSHIQPKFVIYNPREKIHRLLPNNSLGSDTKEFIFDIPSNFYYNGFI